MTFFSKRLETTPSPAGSGEIWGAGLQGQIPGKRFALTSIKRLKLRRGGGQFVFLPTIKRFVEDAPLFAVLLLAKKSVPPPPRRRGGQGTSASPDTRDSPGGGTCHPHPGLSTSAPPQALPIGHVSPVLPPPRLGCSWFPPALGFFGFFFLDFGCFFYIK